MGQQNSLRNETHQLRPSAIGYPDPIVYKFDILVRTHSFTTSRVMPIDKDGNNAVSFDATGRTYPAGTVRTLPPSTIYGFNGIFRARGSTPSTASRCSSGSRTTSMRIR